MSRRSLIFRRLLRKKRWRSHGPPMLSIISRQRHHIRSFPKILRVTYCTLSANVRVCISEPLVAVTTMFELPVGVGVDAGGGGGLLLFVLLLLPPPQPIPVINRAQTSSVKTGVAARLLGLE